MPRVTYLKSAVKKELTIPPENKLNTLMRRYMKAQGMTSQSVADLLGCSDANVRTALNKPPELWKAGDLKKYCIAINLPLSDALAALGESI